jgi:hypothetical protein
VATHEPRRRTAGTIDSVALLVMALAVGELWFLFGLGIVYARLPR